MIKCSCIPDAGSLEYAILNNPAEIAVFIKQRGRMRPPKVLKLFFTLLLSLIFIPSSLQAAENQNDSAVVRRELEAEQAVSRTARRAQQKLTLDKIQKVSFEDILKDPDNVNLNFRYAQQQVAQSDLLGAMGTLERILAVNPDLHEIRLFYAVVLFRLDNLPETERELDALEKAPLSDALRAEWKKYRREVRIRKKRTRFSLRESVGFQFDTNRNAAASSKNALFSDILISNSAENRRRSDEAFLNITSVDAAHDLGFQAGHTLLGSFNYYLQNQNHVDTLDLGSFDYELGGTYKSRIVNFTPTFTASHVFLSDENYLRTQGGNFRFDRTFKDRLTAYLNYRIEHQDYLRIKENDAADQRTGVENGVSLGASYALTPSMGVSASVLYSYKNAKANYEGYDRFMFRTSHSWLLGKGQFLINALEFGTDRYDEQDAAIATIFRKDHTFRYRVTYGAPLTFFQIGRILPGPMKDIVASVGYEYFRSLSNITNYSYTNNKIQALLTKKWEF